jgi:hypothetical protein
MFGRSSWLEVTWTPPKEGSPTRLPGTPPYNLPMEGERARDSLAADQPIAATFFVARWPALPELLASLLAPLARRTSGLGGGLRLSRQEAVAVDDRCGQVDELAVIDTGLVS